MSKYYGQWEITAEESSDDKNYVTLSFADEEDTKGNKHPVPNLNVPVINYDNVVSNEVVDWSTHRDNRLKPVMESILKTLHEYNIMIGVGDGVSPDLPYICDTVVQTIIQHKRKIDEHNWGAPNFMQTIQQMDDHLKKISA